MSRERSQHPKSSTSPSPSQENGPAGPCILDLDPVEALFGPLPDPSATQLSGLIATVHSNERPLHGLSGLLDWRFHGGITRYLKAGALTGSSGECAYLPLQLPLAREGRIYHLILIGAGASASPGSRRPPDDAALAFLKKNLQSLRLPRIGISKSDFGHPPDSYFKKNFDGVPIWIVP